MDATNRLTNVRRTIMSFVMASDIGGVRIFDALDTRQTSDTLLPFVRLNLAEDAAANTGPHPNGGKSNLRTVTLTAECYVPDLTNGQPTPTDSALRIAEDVAGVVQNQNIEVLDFSVAPATGTGTYLQFHTPPRRPEMPPIKGWYRAAVRLSANWFARV